MAAGASSTVVGTLKVLQRAADCVLLLPIAGFLALLALQFVHSPEVRSFWAAVQLHRFGDPFLKEIGSVAGMTWPPIRGWNFLPLAVALGILILKAAYKIMHTTPPPVRSLNPELPADLELMIGRCLNKKPDGRYQTAGELMSLLNALRIKEATP